MNRRDFFKLSALALAAFHARNLPAISAQPPQSLNHDLPPDAWKLEKVTETIDWDDGSGRPVGRATFDRGLLLTHRHYHADRPGACSQVELSDLPDDLRKLIEPLGEWHKVDWKIRRHGAWGIIETTWSCPPPV